MKPLFRNISLVLLLLCNTAVYATEDTVHMYRVTFGVPVTKVVLNGYCRVAVVADSVEYLSTVNLRRIPSPDNLSYRITQAGALILDGASALPKMILHLKMDNAIAFEVNDYCHLDIGSCKMNRLQLEANGYSHANIGIGAGESLDIPTVKVDANDYSHVRLGNIVGTTDYTAKNHDYARIVITGGDILTHLEPLSTDSITLSKGDTVTRRVTLEPYRRNRNSPIVDRNALGFAWGINNWLPRPFDILSRTDGDYEMNSSFRSFHVYYNWYYLRTSHWVMGLGVEYEGGIYSFANPYVQWEAGDGQNTFRAIDRSADEGKWYTRLVTDHIGIPLSVRWSPNGKFYLGLSAIGSMNIRNNRNGLVTYYKTNSAKNRNRQTTPSLLRPYKADVRLTVGGENLMFYLQASVTDLFQNMDCSVYPAQLGLLIEL